MKRSLILSLLLLLLPTLVCAQTANRRRPATATTTQQDTPSSRVKKSQEENLEQFLHSKCNQVIRELALNSFDSAHFEPVYHEMQKEKLLLFRKYGGMRTVRLAIEAGQTLPDSTLMRVVNNNARLQVEDALLEQRYMNQLARILTPLQLFKLQLAEQKFRSEMLKRGKPAKN